MSQSLCTLDSRTTDLFTTGSSKSPVPSRPPQYGFARLGIMPTVLSKRALTELARDGHVAGWDDPRMPRLAGLRRRGVPARRYAGSYAASGFRRPRARSMMVSWAQRSKMSSMSGLRHGWRCSSRSR
ncbi:glutamate--tRNA ligase family protein [Bradyrhizobium canariense]|uniref:glutamate--tRNA ligase family protein n=1 Tax=Bradyrhizobium canariense TaxID=255045 RepID=UPI0035D533DC